MVIQKPVLLETLSTLSRSDQTSPLKLLKVVILWCQTTWAPFITALKSCSGCKCGKGSLGSTTAHRFSPSFLQKCLAESQALLSLPNHSVSFLYLSKLGRTYWLRVFTPSGRHTRLKGGLESNRTRKSAIVGTRTAVIRVLVERQVNSPPHWILGMRFSCFVWQCRDLYPTRLLSTFSRGKYSCVLCLLVRMSRPSRLLSLTTYS